jgi:hypothetical protein
MRAKELLNESVVKTPVTFTYTDNDGRYMGDYVYLNIDAKDLADMLMWCMESDDMSSSGLISEISSKYVRRYLAAVAKRKKELGVDQ